MQRPAAITPVTIAMCVTNFLGFFLVNWTPRPKHHPLGLFIIYTLFICGGYLVLWFFWRGSNWARWLVQITSLLALWNLWELRKPIPPQFQSGVQAPMVTAEALIALFLLYYLNTGAVRTWFTPSAVRQTSPSITQQNP
jgi:hypothetical protein